MLTEYETRGDLKLLRIENEFAKCALFPEHGGHVVEFAPSGCDNILWLSEKSNYAAGKPIRGGIPICWPWFGAHPREADKPAHGFARIAKWNLEGIDELPDGRSVVEMSLSDNAETLGLWPFRFNLNYRVVIGETLSIELTTTNTGADFFEISEALHTYFNVEDVSKISIDGLDAVQYIDTIDDNLTKTQTGKVTFHSEVDRVYLDTREPCVICDPGMNREIRITKNGSASTVVWNPWIAKAARMGDFGDEEYSGMVCVETTNALKDKRTILPCGSHTLSTELALNS